MNLTEFIEEHYGVKARLPDSYGDWLGYQISQYEEGKAETYLQVRSEHLSPSGAVHGGVISGFLDFSCGCAVMTLLKGTEMCSTVELNVKYFKPLKEGDQIVSVTEVVNRGKTLCSVISKVYRGDLRDKPVALATGTFNIYQLKR